jgi:hypothetical protein
MFSSKAALLCLIFSVSVVHVHDLKRKCHEIAPGKRDAICANTCNTSNELNTICTK